MRKMKISMLACGMALMMSMCGGTYVEAQTENLYLNEDGEDMMELLFAAKEVGSENEAEAGIEAIIDCLREMAVFPDREYDYRIKEEEDELSVTFTGALEKEEKINLPLCSSVLLALIPDLQGVEISTYISEDGCIDFFCWSEDNANELLNDTLRTYGESAEHLQHLFEEADGKGREWYNSGSFYCNGNSIESDMGREGIMMILSEFQWRRRVEQMEMTSPGSRPEFVASEYVKDLGTYSGLNAEVLMSGDVLDGIVKYEAMKQWSDGAVIDEGTIAEGDFVNISYVGEEEPYYYLSEAKFEMDAEGPFLGFPDGLVGQPIGEMFSAHMSEEDQERWDYDSDTVYYLVGYVKRPMPYTDENVADFTGGKYTDIASFEASIKEEIIEDELKTMALDTLNEMWFDTATLNGLPEDVLEYDINLGLEYEKKIAEKEYGSWKACLEMLETSEEEVLEFIRNSAEENLIKEILYTAMLEAEDEAPTEGEYYVYGREKGIGPYYTPDYAVEYWQYDYIYRAELRQERVDELLMKMNTYVEVQ